MNRISLATVASLIVILLLVVAFQNCSAPQTEAATSYASSSSSTAIQVSSYPSATQITLGQSTYFTISAYSATGLSLTYQWYKDSVMVAGGTTNSLYIASASASDQANYFVRISDGINTVATPTFYVQVGTATNTISMVTSPVAQTVSPGTITRFEAYAIDSGGKSLSYQWLKNGVAISGQTASELYIYSTVQADAGYYAVVISNGVYSIKSNTVTLTVQATAASCSTLGGTLYSGHCYIVNRTAATWANAQATCKSAGGNLANITSSGENYFVYQITQASVWIGASDEASEGSFVWSDGTAMSFTAWGTAEPNASSSLEDCVEMSSYGYWNDNVCSGTRAFVCEL